jgi:hypothetical protein
VAAEQVRRDDELDALFVGGEAPDLARVVGHPQALGAKLGPRLQPVVAVDDRAGVGIDDDRYEDTVLRDIGLQGSELLGCECGE